MVLGLGYRDGRVTELVEKNIEDLMVKCKQKVVVGGLKGQKLTTSGH